ncbi:MAG: preprotein translocase subunit SecG [Bacilli bacterium]|nr:preprotein translocase subunit SecG [Bacilli bacterium]
MELVLLIVSILLIIIVLLQSGKAEAAGQIMQGGGSELFANTKERGIELFFTRVTMILGILFFVISLVLSLQK